MALKEKFDQHTKAKAEKEKERLKADQAREKFAAKQQEQYQHAEEHWEERERQASGLAEEHLLPLLEDVKNYLGGEAGITSSEGGFAIRWGEDREERTAPMALFLGVRAKDLETIIITPGHDRPLSSQSFPLGEDGDERIALDQPGLLDALEDLIVSLVTEGKCEVEPPPQANYGL